MYKRTDYKKYLHGTGQERLDELAIFEIGGTGRHNGRGAPIIHSLPQRQARRVIYRGIDVHNLYGIYMTREEYRPSSTQTLKKHKSPNKGVDQLVLEWDGKDIPYPFPQESFDEFHSHMVTAKIVRPNQTEYQPSPESFADEVNRLLKSRGTLYLSTDTPHFFGGSTATLPAFGTERADLVDRFIQKLQSHGFIMDVLDCSKNLQQNLQGKNDGVQIGDISLGPLKYFSDVAGWAHVDLVLIATKTSQR